MKGCSLGDLSVKILYFFLSGVEAIKAIIKTPFDLFNTDIQMTMMNGFELLENIF